jgi:hypothetical protein
MEPESYITIIGNQSYEVHTHREIIEKIPAMKAMLNEKTNKILLASCDLPSISNEVLSKAISIAHSVYTDGIEFAADQVPYFIRGLPKVTGRKEDIASWKAMTHVWHALESFGFEWASSAKPFLCTHTEESEFSSCTFNASQLNLKHIAPFCLIQSVLHNVSTIDFSHNALTYISTEMFAYLPQLEVINLSNNRISQLQENCFSNLPRVRILDLAENDLAEHPEGVFDELQSLEIIYFQHSGPLMFSMRSLQSTFGSIENLKVLLMTYDQYGPAAQKRIREILPHATVEFVFKNG